MRIIFIQRKILMKKRKHPQLTITVDDAGSGDLLFGVVIGAYRDDTQEFKYDVIDVKFFQPELFRKKEYLTQTSKIVTQLLDRLQPTPEEEIHLCQGYIFDAAADNLKKAYGENRIRRVRVIGEPQRLVEIAYLDEIRNLGYEPLPERDEKRAKNFFHMLRWLKANPTMIQYAKTGWPRLSRYRIFNCNQKNFVKTKPKLKYHIVCSECGKKCKVPFKPIDNRPVYCKSCWAKKKNLPQKIVN